MVYSWALNRVVLNEDINVDEWETELISMLPWQSEESEALMEMASNDFMAMMNAGGGG